MLLIYKTRTPGKDWEEIQDKIPFTWTACHYGGKRQWFLCPSCQRKVAVLYGGEYFRCRHCQNLTYSCQQETRPDRLMRKNRKIKERLGVEPMEPVIFKPKNMHQKTFDHLRLKAELARAMAWESMKKQYLDLLDLP